MKRILYSIAFFSTVLIGCTEDSKEIVSDSKMKLECYARSGNSTTIVKDFGMYVLDGSSAYNGIINPVHVTYDNEWVFSKVILSEPAKIYAFYPYQSTSDLTILNLSLTQQNDYLATSSPIYADKDNPSIQIIMDHLLAKINITIDGSDNLSFSATNMETSAKYNLSTNTISVLQSSGTVTSKGASMLIFPGNNKSLSLTIDYNGKSYTYIASAKDYEAGKEYTYNLNISDTQELVIQGDVKITDWETGGNYEDSVME